MRYAITVVLLIICGFAFGQVDTTSRPGVYQSMPQNGYGPVKRMVHDSVLVIPEGLTALRNLAGARNRGQIRYNVADSSLYMWTGTQWVKPGGSGITPPLQSVTSIGNTTDNGIELSVNSGNPAPGSGVLLHSLYPYSLSIKNQDNIDGSVRTDLLTSSRIYELPDKDGTFAMLSDITGGGSGTVTSFSSGNFSPLFTTGVATSTTTPALSFSMSDAPTNTFLGRLGAGSGIYSFINIGLLDSTNNSLWHTEGWYNGLGYIPIGGTLPGVPVTGDVELSTVGDAPYVYGKLGVSGNTGAPSLMDPDENNEVSPFGFYRVDGPETTQLLTGTDQIEVSLTSATAQGLSSYRFYPNKFPYTYAQIHDIDLTADSLRGEIADSVAGMVTLTGTQTLTNKTLTSPKHTVQALTDGATIMVDMNNGDIGTVTIAGNRILAFSNLSSGQYFQMIITQDVVGGRTLTLPASTKVINGGAGAVTLSTAAGSVDILTFSYVGTTLYCNYGKNYN